MDLLHLTEQSARVSCAGPPQLQITHGVGVTVTITSYTPINQTFTMLSPPPRTLQPGWDLDGEQIQRCQVSLEPGPNPAAGGLSGALTRDYGSKLRSGHPALGSVQCHQNHLESVPCVSTTVYSASSMTED